MAATATAIVAKTATAIAGRHYLIADARERAIAPFLTTALGAERLLANRQVNTGDYLVCARPRAIVSVAAAASTDTVARTDSDVPGLRVRACIERKTLADFAASFKDGRHANLQKMRDLRARTGCQLYYIVEGPAFPSPGRRFARIPYASILAAITHMMVRDSIMVVQTENEAHTARRLVDLLDAFDRFDSDCGAPTAVAGGAPAAVVGGAPATEAGGAPPVEPAVGELAIPEGLTGRIEVPDDEAVAALWARLHGVSLLQGKIISAQFSVAGLVSGRVPAARIQSLKTATGRAAHPRAIASLRAVAAAGAAGAAAAPDVAVRIVSGLRGVTPAAAALLLAAAGGLRQLATAAPSATAEYRLPHGDGTARLGLARAARYWRLLNYGEPAASAAPAAEAAELAADAAAPAANAAAEPAAAKRTTKRPAQRPAEPAATAAPR